MAPLYEYSEDDRKDLSVAYVDTQENPPDFTNQECQIQFESTLLSMGDARSAIFVIER